MSSIVLLLVVAVFGLLMLAVLVGLVVWLVRRSSPPSQASQPERDGSSHG